MLGNVVVVVSAALASADETPAPPAPPPAAAPAPTSIAAPDALIVDEDAVLTTSLQVPEGAQLRLKRGPRRGAATLDEATGAFVYTPQANFNGEDSVVVDILVGGKKRGRETLKLEVRAQNDVPVASGFNLATREEAATGARITASDVDNDALSFSIGTQPQHGTATVDAKGNVAFTPATNANGADSFTVVVDDGHGGQVTVTIAVKITAVNDAPAVAAAAVTTNEDEVGTTTLAASDVDADTLQFAVSTAPKNGTASVDAEGHVRYTPRANFNGVDSFSVVVKDPAGAAASATVSVTVAAVNDAPAAPSPVVSTAEEVAVDVVVAASDVDGDAVTLDVKSIDAAKGTASVVDGRVRVVPALNVNGAVAVVVTATDGKGGSTDIPVTVNVTPVNDAPTIDNATVTTREDTERAFALTTTDVDGDALSYTVVQQPALGRVRIDGAGSLTFTPAGDKHGSDRCIVVVKDRAGAEARATVDFVVEPQNDPPRISDAAATVAEDGVVEVNVQASDVDGDELQWRVEPATNASASIERGRLHVQPAHDFNGAIPVTVVVSDGHGGEARATAAITVTPVNDAPVAKATALRTDEDRSGSIEIDASDVDGDALRFSIKGGARLGAVSVDRAGKVTFAPNANANGAERVTVVVTDSAGASVDVPVDVTVVAVNDVPTVAELTLGTREETATTAPLDVKDLDGDVLAFSIKQAPEHGSASVDAKGVVTYTPALDHNGNDSFVVLVDDGHGGQAERAIAALVVPVNDRPVAAPMRFTVDEDGVLTAPLTATDVDGDTLHYVVFAPPGTGKAVLARDGQLRFTPPRDWHGSDKLTVEIDDGKLWTRADVTIVVTPVNDAPVTNGLSLKTDEDKIVRGTATARDIDGDALRFALRTPPAHGEAVVDPSGKLQFMPAADWHGADRFTVAALDGTTETEATVDIVIAPTPDAPRVHSATLSLNEDTPAEGALPGTEPDGEPMTFALVGAPRLGDVVLVDARAGRVRYTPRLNANGKDDIAFTTTDGTTTVKGVLSVDVAAVNDPPVAQAATGTTAEDTAVEVTIAMSDVDADRPVVQVSGAVDGGTVEVVDGPAGRLRVLPARDKNGAVRFKVVAKEALTSAPVDVVVKIQPVNDGPTLRDGRFVSSEDAVLTNTLVSNDVDGDALTWRIARPPTRGEVTINSTTGEFHYTPRPNTWGPDSFAIAVRDPSGLEATAGVELEVNAVDDPPVAIASRIRAPRAGSITGVLSGRDAEGAALRYVIVKQPVFGKVKIVDDSTGTYTYYAAGSAHPGPSSFTFAVVADGKQSEPAVVEIEPK
jgi:VCBS repeat-containing protein